MFTQIAQGVGYAVETVKQWLGLSSDSWYVYRAAHDKARERVRS